LVSHGKKVSQRRRKVEHTLQFCVVWTSKHTKRREKAIRVDTRVREYTFRIGRQVSPSAVRNETQNGNVTDPYRPPVWTMPSDDLPFVFRISDELPAMNRGMTSVSAYGQMREQDRQVETGHGVPELHDQRCSKLWILVSGTGLKSVRTFAIWRYRTAPGD
jgi:hypothetical protein